MGFQTLHGAALDTTLAFALSADGLTFTLADNQHWPDGAQGYFVVLMDDGTVKKEYLLCKHRVGTLVTVSQRGYFGTTGVVHAKTAAVVAYDLDANIQSRRGFNLELVGALTAADALATRLSISADATIAAGFGMFIPGGALTIVNTFALTIADTALLQIGN